MSTPTTVTCVTDANKAATADAANPLIANPSEPAPLSTEDTTPSNTNTHLVGVVESPASIAEVEQSTLDQQPEDTEPNPVALPIAAAAPTAEAVAAAAAAAFAVNPSTDITDVATAATPVLAVAVDAVDATTSPVEVPKVGEDAATTGTTAETQASEPNPTTSTPAPASTDAPLPPFSLNFDDPLPFALKPMAPILHTLRNNPHGPSNDLPASTPFPSSYQPRTRDICNGRGKSHWNLPGNKAFRKYVQVRVYDYMQVESKVDKTKYVMHCVQELRQLGFQFIRENKDGLWYELGDAVARNKVGHSLRDQVAALRKLDTPNKRKRGGSRTGTSNKKRVTNGGDDDADPTTPTTTTTFLTTTTTTSSIVVKDETESATATGALTASLEAVATVTTEEVAATAADTTGETSVTL